MWLLPGNSPTDGREAASVKLTRPGKADARSARERVQAAMPATLPQREKKQAMRLPADLFAHLKGLDRKRAEALQEALDNEDFSATAKAAKEALRSENPEIRQNAVEALGWFGAEALPELTTCMADADEDVRNAAANLWELAVQELESPAEQLPVVMAAFGALKDEDQLTSLGGILGGAALQWIDGEEDAGEVAKRRLSVVQGLVDIIEGEGCDPRNVAAAKQAFEDVCGHEWISFEEAGRYLEDPEGYDPQAEPTADTAEAAVAAEPAAETPEPAAETAEAAAETETSVNITQQKENDNEEDTTGSGDTGN